MTLQQLEYIVALDTYRHFVTAAEHCFVTQPTLTMQVKKLEEEIGVKIFDRNSKPLRPTEAGVFIISKARQILREIEQLKVYLMEEKELLHGEFTLGIIPTLAPYVLPLFLPEFVRANPNTHLKIQELQTEQIIERLKKGMLDVGLLATPLGDRAIREIPLFYEPFLLYLPDGHRWMEEDKISSAYLDPEGMLIMEEGHCFREQALAICSNQPGKNQPGFDYESGSIEALKGLVKRGLGYTLVPEFSVIDELASPRVKRFESPEPVREVSLAVRNTFTKEALIDQLHGIINKSVPERFKKSKKYKKITWR